MPASLGTSEPTWLEADLCRLLDRNPVAREPAHRFFAGSVPAASRYGA